MQNSLTPKNQEELDARIELAQSRQQSFDASSIMGMLDGRCLGGSFSPLCLEFRYESKDWMKNPLGMTHGGMLAAMFDNAMGTAAFILSPYGGTAPTAELHVSYLKPVPLGATLDIRVLCDHIGSRMIRLRAELRLTGGDGALYATAAAVNCPSRIS